MADRIKRAFNIVFICFGVAVALVIVIGMIVTYPSGEATRMTKAEFVELAESGDDDALYDKASLWSEQFCPIENAKKFDEVATPVKHVMAMMHLDGEVLNGGFSQFYYNGYHTYGFDYAAAFRAAGLDEVADIYLRADACFQTIKHRLSPRSYDPDAYFDWAEDNPLDEYDDEYADRQEEIFAAIVGYIKNNISCFGN